MLLCAVVGLALVVAGTWALPRPTAVVHAQEPAVAPVSAAPATPGTPGSTAPGPASSTPSGSSTSAGPSAPARPTPSASSRPEPSTGEPAATSVPESGPGTYATADVSVPSSTHRGRLYTYDVRIEKGLDLDPDQVARALQKTLDDPRSWRWTGKVRFALVPAGKDADLHAYVVTPGTTDRLCYPLLTRGDVSCRSGSKVVLNAKRFVLGAEAFGPDDAAYRDYLVNHEFGHALGHHHVGCAHRGDPAPVMLQQTKGLQGCTANPWPSVTHG